MSVNITLPSMDKPLHIVVWQDSNVDGYSSNVTVLNERIAKLEAAIERLTLSSLTGASSSTPTAVVSEKKTPLISGIDMKRMPESTGSLSAVNPPDVRNILYNLITQPPLSSINKYINPDTPSSSSPILKSYACSVNNIEVDEAPFDLDAGDEDSTINLLSAQEEDADAAGLEEDDADAAGLEADAVGDDADAVEEDEADALEEEEAAAEEEEDAAEEEEEDAAAEEDDAPELEEEDAAEEEEEDAAEELEDFEYKGTTYWKDSQNQVYITDETGDLVDQPYGVWSDEKKKVLKYPK